MVLMFRETHVCRACQSEMNIGSGLDPLQPKPTRPDFGRFRFPHLAASHFEIDPSRFRWEFALRNQRKTIFLVKAFCILFFLTIENLLEIDQVDVPEATKRFHVGRARQACSWCDWEIDLFWFNKFFNSFEFPDRTSKESLRKVTNFEDWRRWGDCLNCTVNQNKTLALLFCQFHNWPNSNCKDVGFYYSMLSEIVWQNFQIVQRAAYQIRKLYRFF